MSTHFQSSLARLFSRVPRVTVDLLIKLLAVSMGETAADYLAINLGFGLTTTTLMMIGVLVAWPLSSGSIYTCGPPGWPSSCSAL